MCTHIIWLTKQKLTYYTGNYDTFCKTVKENEVIQQKKYEKEQDDIKHLKAFISSCGMHSLPSTSMAFCFCLHVATTPALELSTWLLVLPSYATCYTLCTQYTPHNFPNLSLLGFVEKEGTSLDEPYQHYHLTRTHLVFCIQEHTPTW